MIRAHPATASALIGTPGRALTAAEPKEARIEVGEPGRLDAGRPRPPERLAPDGLHLDLAAREEVDKARGLVGPHRGGDLELPVYEALVDGESERPGRRLDLVHEGPRLGGEARVGADP